MSEPDEMGLTPEAAQGYEQYFVPAIFDQWPSRMIEAAAVKTGDNVLEVGCGTGVLARQVVRQVGATGQVTGLDLSESMLSVAREICPSVHFQQGNAMDLPFEEGTFDVAFASFVMMFVPDQKQAVAELWRVLKPGGRLVISIWEALAENPVYAALVDIARDRIDEPAGDSLAAPFALGEQGLLLELCQRAGVSTPEVSQHQGRAQFPSIDDFVTPEIQAWVLSSVVTDKDLESVVRDARQTFAGYCDPGGALNVPLNALFAQATKP